MADESHNDVEALRQRIRVLEDVLGEAYQFAGTVGAPVRVLDNLAAAAEGQPLPHQSFLPIAADECDLRERVESQDGRRIVLDVNYFQQLVGVGRGTVAENIQRPAGAAFQGFVDLELSKGQRTASTSAQTLFPELRGAPNSAQMESHVR